MLLIPAGVWKILQANDGLKGITLPQAPTANPDGSYTIRMTPDQWQIFQVNQQSQPTQSAPEPASPDDDSVTATKDPSTFNETFIGYLNVKILP